LRSDLELVLKESQRAREVVRRLLEFSRPSENQRIQTDINELVEDVLNLVHHLTVTGGIQVSIDLCDELPWVSVDPAQIKQVLLNLVHNSIQAMSGGGELIIKTGHSRQDNVEWLTISVSDTGVGIASENMERIFEPFFTTRPAGQGTGLGLSVSYGIVTDHGGYIEAQSQPGKGSHFTVYLPLDKPV
jgi:signal transduction histidine kinase